LVEFEITLVNIGTIEPIAIITVIATAFITAVSVHTVCEFMTQTLEGRSEQWIGAFIDIGTVEAIAIVTEVTCTIVITVCVNARGVLVACVQFKGAFINIGTVEPVTLETVDARAVVG